MKLNEWLNTWLHRNMKYRVKNRTLSLYGDVIKNHIQPVLGEYDLDNLTPQVLQDFVNNRLEKGNNKTGKGLSANTVIVIVNILKQIIKDANIFEVTTRDSTRTIKMPHQEESKVSAFEREEQEKIERYCLNSKKTNYIGIVLCLYTGLRIGELLALTWEDVDFQKKCIHICKTAYEGKGENKIKIVVDSPKTVNFNRVIPISRQLIEILKSAKIKSNSKFIIATRKGEMVGTRSYQKTFERILSILDIPHRNFHCLRHTFATRALEFGMDIKTVSEILGHRSPTVTLQKYSHSLFGYKTDMMNRFGKLLIFN